jgi:Family of unknown function (DUF6163)
MMRFTTVELRRRHVSPTLLDLAFLIASRLLGLVALGLSLTEFARLVGIGGLDPSRFDLMPVAWRVAATMLAVFYAAAGFGLWQVTNWGFAVWAFAGLAQIAMHTLYSNVFGVNFSVVAVLVLLIISHGCFVAYYYWQRSQERL